MRIVFFFFFFDIAATHRSARLLDCHFVGMVAAHEETNGRIALERIDMWDRQTWGIAFRNR